MSKTTTGVVLILLTGSLWLYLDYINKQETKAIEEMRLEIQLAHERSVAEMKALMENRSRLESAIVSDLNSCYAAAEKTNYEYIANLRKPTNKKSELITISKTELNKAATTLESDRKKCQQTYESMSKRYTP